MIPVNEAIQIVQEQTRQLPAEAVALADAMGRVLAEDVIADSDLPPFDRAQMDGYAMRAVDTRSAPASLRIVGESAAGRGWHNMVQAGEAVRIMTGAPVPAGADSVQKVEVTRELNGETVEIAEASQPGQFIVKRASEIKAGELVLSAGEEINAAMMAALASFGYAKVKVGQRPRVAVLATGTELVAVDQKPGLDQIRDSNSYSLGAYSALAGAGEVERLPLAGDDMEVLKREIQEAAARSDALILSGGVSMGVYDFTKAALHALDAEIFFERVSLRPGKPTVFARLGRTLIFGLPGNPVSVSVTFNLFARTALRAMQGARDAALKEEWAVLTRGVKGSIERASYLPACLTTNEDGHLLANPLKWGGSSDFVAFARATALVIVPEGVRAYGEGTRVRIVRLPG